MAENYMLQRTGARLSSYYNASRTLTLNTPVTTHTVPAGEVWVVEGGHIYIGGSTGSMLLRAGASPSVITGQFTPTLDTYVPLLGTIVLFPAPLVLRAGETIDFYPLANQNTGTKSMMIIGRKFGP